MSSATIYTTDGKILTEGLQPAWVCDEAIRIAGVIAEELEDSVVLDDSDGVWLVKVDKETIEIDRAQWESEDCMIVPLTDDA